MRLHWRGCTGPANFNTIAVAFGIRITESLEQSKAGLRFKPPKNGKARAVTLPAFALDGLRRLKREQAEALLKLDIRQDANTLLCSLADGEPMLPQKLNA
jgi:hypothetical protein